MSRMGKLVLLIILFASFKGTGTTLPINSKAPDFNLMGVDGKMYSLNSFSNSKVLVIIFTSNHCPTAQAYENRINSLAKYYSSNDVQFVAISSNSDKSIRLDDLAFSDLGDSFEEMKLRAKEKDFKFPYLFDGDSQEAAIKFSPTATPQAFVFDKKRILRYAGRIDDHIKEEKVTRNDLKLSIEEILKGKKPKNQVTKTLGCSIKWNDEISKKKIELEDWAKEPVSIEEISIEKTQELIQEQSGKYKLINVWATWCSTCMAEFKDLCEINKMYRKRDFEFISISLDELESKPTVLNFLKEKMASNNNYIFVGNKYDFIEEIDPNWEGALPYTILISPEKEIVFSKMGEVLPLDLKKVIIENIGRYNP